MPTSFLAYWKPQTVDINLASGGLLDHSASDQFARVSPGDLVWIITVRDGVPSMLGRIVVHRIVDQETAAAYLGRSGLWDSSHHILATEGSASPLVEVKVPNLVEILRFKGPNDRLTTAGDLVNAQQLQTMRILTPESADRLEAEFTQALTVLEKP